MLGDAHACRQMRDIAAKDCSMRRMLPPLASGESLATVALAEEGGAWLPEQWSLAAPDGETGTISGSSGFRSGTMKLAKLASSWRSTKFMTFRRVRNARNA